MHTHWVIVAQHIVCQSSRCAVTHGCTEMIQHGRHYLLMLQLEQVWGMDSDSCKCIHEFMQHHSMFLHCQQKAELTSRCSQSRPNMYSAGWLRYTGICVADSAALNWVIHNCRHEVRSGSTLYISICASWQNIDLHDLLMWGNITGGVCQAVINLAQTDLYGAHPVPSGKQMSRTVYN